MDDPESKTEAKTEAASTVMTSYDDTCEAEDPVPAKTCKEMLKAWPKSTLLIIGNEFAERFSFYGMRTVLTLYLLNVLRFSEDNSITFYNSFTGLCYATPIIGAIIADGYIGRYKTILYVSILYTCGQILLAASSTMNSGAASHPYLDLVGLFIIGVGTGGIKPCVSPFGGDQFDKHETKMISVFFAVFYFSINAGSTISTYLTPYFRSLSCFGEDSCFPLAFGVPAAAMIVATILFAVGTPWYRKPKLNRSNVFADVFRVIFVALKNRIKNTNKTKGRPCLDYYLDTHQCKNDPTCQGMKKDTGNTAACAKVGFVYEVKCLLRMLVMFLPIPFFWALYDQQGTTWVLQGVYMDCRIVDSWVVPPDQMQVANAAMIILLIPIFQFGVYPLIEKCVKLTILRKQVAGGVIAALAYVLCGIVQIQVEKTMPVLPADGRAFLSVINGFESCSLTASIGNGQMMVGPRLALENDRTNKKLFDLTAGQQTIQFAFTGCANAPPPSAVQLNLQAKQINFVYVDAKGWISGVSATKKPTDGNGEHSVSFLLALDEEYTGSLALCKDEKGTTNEQHPCSPGTAADFVYFAKSGVKNVTYTPWEGQAANPQAKLFSFQSVRPGKWRLYYTKSEPKTNNRATKPEQFDAQFVGYEVERFEQGGVYLNVLSGQKANPLNTTFRAVEHNSMSILWQLPQIFIITTAEILISITGNEFSYTQAPPSMKSFASSLFLLTVCAGDQMITIVRLFHIGNQTVEFFLWAGAMLLATVALALLAIFYYEYVDYENLKDKQTGARTAAPSIASTTPAEQAPANVLADSDGPETANVNAAQ